MSEEQKKLGRPSRTGDQTSNFSLRLTDEERKVLDMMAEERGCTPSDILRRAIHG